MARKTLLVSLGLMFLATCGNLVIAAPAVAKHEAAGTNPSGGNQLAPLKTAMGRGGPDPLWNSHGLKGSNQLAPKTMTGKEMPKKTLESQSQKSSNKLAPLKPMTGNSLPKQTYKSQGQKSGNKLAPVKTGNAMPTQTGTSPVQKTQKSSNQLAPVKATKFDGPPNPLWNSPGQKM